MDTSEQQTRSKDDTLNFKDWYKLVIQRDETDDNILILKFIFITGYKRIQNPIKKTYVANETWFNKLPRVNTNNEIKMNHTEIVEEDEK